jgi:hypothetical protein
MRFLAIPVLLLSCGSAAAGPKEMEAELLKCWSVGSLSVAALTTSVIVDFAVIRNVEIDRDSISLVRYSNGSSAAGKQAFQVARRAIIRCGAKGVSHQDWVLGVRFFEATFYIDEGIKVVAHRHGLSDD